MMGGFFSYLTGAKFHKKALGNIAPGNPLPVKKLGLQMVQSAGLLSQKWDRPWMQKKLGPVTTGTVAILAGVALVPLLLFGRAVYKTSQHFRERSRARQVEREAYRAEKAKAAQQPPAQPANEKR